MEIIEQIARGEVVDFTQEDNKILGDIGEQLVKSVLCGTLSDDYWDTRKDGTDFFGREIEVKTQARMDLNNCFSVPNSKTQRAKIQNVDRLIFVEYDDTKYIKIWEAVDRTVMKFKTDRDKMPIAGMISLTVIESVPLSNLMRKYSTRHYKNKPLRGLILNED